METLTAEVTEQEAPCMSEVVYRETQRDNDSWRASLIPTVPANYFGLRICGRVPQNLLEGVERTLESCEVRDDEGNIVGIASDHYRRIVPDILATSYYLRINNECFRILNEEDRGGIASSIYACKKDDGFAFTDPESNKWRGHDYTSVGLETTIRAIEALRLLGENVDDLLEPSTDVLLKNLDTYHLASYARVAKFLDQHGTATKEVSRIETFLSETLPGALERNKVDGVYSGLSIRRGRNPNIYSNYYAIQIIGILEKSRIQFSEPDYEAMLAFVNQCTSFGENNIGKERGERGFTLLPGDQSFAALDATYYAIGILEFLRSKGVIGSDELAIVKKETTKFALEHCTFPADGFILYAVGWHSDSKEIHSILDGVGLQLK